MKRLVEPQTQEDIKNDFKDDLCKLTNNEVSYDEFDEGNINYCKQINNKKEIDDKYI